MTLAALNLELDKLVEPKKGTQEMEFGFQAKTRLVWKKSSMKQLLEPNARPDEIIATPYLVP